MRNGLTNQFTTKAIPYKRLCGAHFAPSAPARQAPGPSFRLLKSPHRVREPSAAPHAFWFSLLAAYPCRDPSMGKSGSDHLGGESGAQAPSSRRFDAIIAELREAVASQLGDPSPDGTLPGLVRRAASQAHADGLTADQLVLEFRTIWDTLPGAAHASSGARADMQWRVVGALIASYYEDRMAYEDHMAARGEF